MRKARIRFGEVYVAAVMTWKDGDSWNLGCCKTEVLNYISLYI